MVKTMLIVLSVLLGTSVIGCSSISKEIVAKSVSERADVFREIDADAMASSENAELVISAQIKTYLEGYHFLESQKSPHGKPRYPFMFNIDGQYVLWEADGLRETTPSYDEEGKRTPEGGDGMRYKLTKKISISRGPHKVFVALPGDNFFKEFQIELKGGEQNALELKPVYWHDRRRSRSFYNGIEDFKVFLNGVKVR